MAVFKIENSINAIASSNQENQGKNSDDLCLCRLGGQAALGIAVESPQRAMDFAQRQGEDLERKALAACNAHIHKSQLRKPN